MNTTFLKKMITSLGCATLLSSALQAQSSSSTTVLTGPQTGPSQFLGSSSLHDVLFKTGTASVPVERMRLTTAGNFGIGTQSPSYKLNVVTLNNMGFTASIENTGGNGSGLLIKAGNVQNLADNLYTQYGGAFRLLDIQDNTGTSFFKVSGKDGSTTMNSSFNTGYTSTIINGGGNGSGLLIKAGFVQSTSTSNMLDVQDYAGNKSYLRVSGKDGSTWARAIYVTELNFPDYVFNNNYKLMPINEIEKYISLNHHLPEVPSALEVAEKGMNVGELQKIQMQKIEELTLYVIQMNKEIEILKKKNEELKQKISN